jgi:integrase
LVVWPKLFRRIVPYQAERHGGFDGFDAWLRADPVHRDDELFLLDRLERGNNRTAMPSRHTGRLQRLLRHDPPAGMHGPQRPAPRQHLPPDRGLQLINRADQLAEKASAQATEEPDARRCQLRLFRAEQDALLVRLAAETGLRRGELAALKITDLDTLDNSQRIALTSRCAATAVARPRPEA